MKINTILLVTTASILAACGTKAITKDDVIGAVAYETVDEANMDKAVSPKEDFFQFANGTWCKNNPVPDSESRWGSFNELDKANKVKLLTILENASANPGAKGSQNQILGDYYKSFIDFDTRNKVGIGAISDELSLVDGIKSKEDLPVVIAKLHKYGVGNTFYFGIGQDMKNVSQNIANLYQSGIGLPNKDYYTDTDKKNILEAYQQHIMKMFEYVGYTRVQAKETSISIIKFEKMMAINMMSPSEQRIPENTYNLMELVEAKNLFEEFRFDAYLNTLGMDNMEKIVVGQPDFMKGIHKIYQSLSLADWKAYLNWKVLDHYAGHLTKELADLNFDFYGKVLSGKKEMKPLNDQVIEEITGMIFNELLGKAFVDEHFSASAQKRVNEMVDNLLLVFDERIQNLSWMTPETKKEALKKLNSIGRKLGFPSEWQDFSKLNFTSSNYIDNVRKSNQFAVNKNYAKLGKPVNKKEWGMPAHMVNAYYHPLLNEIAFPAGIMQPPFFSDQYEDAVNYGRIGMVIGHEFTHGFDDMGSKFAADGSFSNWWTAADRKSFEEKTGIFGQTYSAFCPISDHCVNPELTMGENIADLGGLTLAYYAYTKTREFQSGITRKGYTPAQRFFISYAQLWKINYTEEELKNRLANDPHSPGMYRVNGPLKNCPEFFTAFDVKEGDAMRNKTGKVANIW
jgi:putative endopeptidase